MEDATRSVRTTLLCSLEAFAELSTCETISLKARSHSCRADLWESMVFVEEVSLKRRFTAARFVDVGVGRERLEQETSFFQFPFNFELTRTNWNQYSIRRKVSESIVSRNLFA